jgi:hypothetical protein
LAHLLSACPDPDTLHAVLQLARSDIVWVKTYMTHPHCGSEEAALRQIEVAGAITTSVVSIATKLAPDFTTDVGKQMFGIVQKLRLS